MRHEVMMPVAMFEEIMARWKEDQDGDLGAGGTPLAGRTRAQVSDLTASNTTRLSANLALQQVTAAFVQVSRGRDEG